MRTPSAPVLVARNAINSTTQLPRSVHSILLQSESSSWNTYVKHCLVAVGGCAEEYLRDRRHQLTSSHLTTPPIINCRDVIRGRSLLIMTNRIAELISTPVGGGHATATLGNRDVT